MQTMDCTVVKKIIASFIKIQLTQKKKYFHIEIIRAIPDCPSYEGGLGEFKTKLNIPFVNIQWRQND